MSQFRASQIYVQSQTRRLLSLIARAKDDGTTADEIGDTLLRQTIVKEHPQLDALIKEMEVLEGKIVESIRNG